MPVWSGQRQASLSRGRAAEQLMKTHPRRCGGTYEWIDEGQRQTPWLPLYAFLATTKFHQLWCLPMGSGPSVSGAGATSCCLAHKRRVVDEVEGCAGATGWKSGGVGVV